MAKVAVVGSGIAGLVAARFAQDNGHTVKVFEAGEIAGGKIRSVELQDEVVETGPQTLLSSHEFFDSLVALAGLEGQIRQASSRVSTRYIWKKGRLHALPTSPGSAFGSSLVGPLGLMRALFEPMIGPGQFDETVAKFFSRRIGTKLTNNLVDPFVSGVWAGDINRLSAAGAFPKLVSWVNEHGSLLKGALASRRTSAGGSRGIVSFKGGLSALVDGLVSSLTHPVLCQRKLTSLQAPESADDSWVLKFDRGGSEKVDRVVLAVPPGPLSGLIRPLDVSLSSALAVMSVPAVAVVNLLLSAKDASPVSRPEGYGALVASGSPAGRVLGVLTVSDVFPRADESELFTVYLGGRRFPEIANYSDGELITEAVKGVKTLYGFTPHVIGSLATLHKQAIPQYEGGQLALERMKARVEESVQGLTLVGNWTGGGSVLDAAMNAAAAVKRWEPSQV